MKSSLWIVFLAAFIPFTAGGAEKQALQSTQTPGSTPSPAEVQVDRNLSAPQAADLALSVIRDDQKLLQHFIDPKNKNIKVSLRPDFDAKAPVANSKASYEFFISFEDPELESEFSYARVAVNRHTGELLFNGNWYCNEGFVKRDQFLKCLSAPIVRKFPKPTIPTKRDLNCGEAEDLALWVIHDDITLLKNLIDPADKNHRIFLEAGCARSDFLPPEMENFEFEVYTESVGSGHASWYASVRVHHKTGQILFTGNFMCDEAWVPKDKFVTCLKAPPDEPME